MPTVREVLARMNIRLEPYEKVIIYGNSYFNSPIEALMDDISENDYAYAIVPKNSAAPTSLQEINLNRYRLYLLPTP